VGFNHGGITDDSLIHKPDRYNTLGQNRPTSQCLTQPITGNIMKSPEQMYITKEKKSICI
jgi:hypothetical protein